MLNAPLRWPLDRVTTPLGVMLLVTDTQNTLRALDWADSEARMLDRLRLLYGSDEVTLTSGTAPQPIRNALEAYWAGDLNAVSAIPVETAGTEFQRDAWAWLRSIPAGETRSYREQARGMDRASAVRAVGRANGANPIGIVIPCHRVIGADGTLTGYAGGMERKRWLLRHEGGDF
ncbi:methylated-DNA--[protein]-cysteine S-methyltransferase [Acidithiobacillus ferrianus]|uniref:methylated-DNA--[protein]-cysteine S-methyltransferase n=2 Tax=Acidithiobacillus ferrianus TaxID=2678518 RepID=A0A845UHG7_9PROT|nr:methylated-DNA--[protein]-cysteine S-methyltransferase [Acidithiobacillus ferrianus]NDU43970.1 methylated-DNA--[protein]-cysteine S-methyltransferase [Acidithiobacillus ferrianus]